jgi:outer membrane receptor for ferrienterochelin and colicins
MNKILTLLFSFSTPILFAQTAKDSVQSLQEVTVTTGQYKPQSIKSAVQQIRVITKDQILKQAAPNVETVLKNQLNIRFNQDVATGGSDITMMGIKGQNVKILLDGLPLIGRQGTSNEININQIDINTIERIEIVEGPMAVVYGADALAGVINIITKKSIASTLSVFAKLQEESVGKEYGGQRGIHNQSVGLDWRKNNWELGANFSHNYFGGWKDSAVDRELVWHKKDQLLAGGYIGYQKNKFGIRYGLNALDEIITNPANFDAFANQISGDFTANDQQYISHRVMQQLQSSYNFNNNLNALFQSSYTNYTRQVYSTLLSKNTGKESLDLAEGKQSMIRFNGLTARGLVNYRVSKIISLQPGIDINVETGEGERLAAGKNTITDAALFLTAEITPTSKLNIKPGVRFIKNSIYNAPPLVSSINTKYSFTNNIDLRASYARGFRSPSLRELYFNFFDANHQIIGNPDLKAETSNSFTASLNWNKTNKKNVYTTASITGFYNEIKNLIDYALDINNPNDYILSNVANSKTAGAAINGSVRFNHWNIALGAAYTGFFNDFYGTDKSLPQLQWSPELNSTIGYSLPKIGLDLNLFYKLNGKKPYYALDNNQNILQAFQKGYQLADFTVNKKLFKVLSLNTGIRNIFDVDRLSSTFTRTGGVHNANNGRSIATGRSYFIGINFNWDKK